MRLLDSISIVNSKQGISPSKGERPKLLHRVGLSFEENNDYDLGFWIARDYWGKGYATEAAMGLIQYVKKEFKLKQIKACHIKGNTASSNVLRSLGFEETGECEEFFLSRGQVMSCIQLELNF